MCKALKTNQQQHKVNSRALGISILIQQIQRYGLSESESERKGKDSQICQSAFTNRAAESSSTGLIAIESLIVNFMFMLA